jgi:hypothetical protein
MLSIDLGDDVLWAVHKSIEQGIAGVESRITTLPEEPKDEGEEAWKETVIEESGILVEGLIGVGFVVVQTYITAIRADIRRLGQSYERERGSQPTFAVGDLLEAGPKFADTQYTRIDLINAVANYWKHHEEWSADWDKLTGLQKRTAVRMQALGGSPGSGGNLRTAAMTLGMLSTFSDFGPVRTEARRWAGELYGAAESEIKAPNGL